MITGRLAAIRLAMPKVPPQPLLRQVRDATSG
jgi:hypothetical protein